MLLPVFMRMTIKSDARQNYIAESMPFEEIFLYHVYYKYDITYRQANAFQAKQQLYCSEITGKMNSAGGDMQKTMQPRLQ